MDSRACVRATLEHREPDRVPRDLGAVRMTGIHVRAYGGLRRALGLAEREVRVGDLSQPGGGFVFAAVHNIQANVPPENVAAMWEAVEAWGAYPAGAYPAGAYPAGSGAAS